MNKKLFGILNLLLIATVFVGNYFYLSEFSIFKKAFCSGGFALIGLVNLLYAFLQKTKQKKFCVSMSVGLVLAMLGDIVLNYDFVIGAALFAAGHICYFAAYCFSLKITPKDLVPSAVLFIAAASFILFCPLLEFGEPIMQYVCLVYALVISVMTGKAFSNFLRNKNTFYAILMVGSILFFFSDLMLVFDWFLGMGRIAGILCMSTYYPAQCLLAFSVYYFVSTERSQQYE